MTESESVSIEQPLAASGDVTPLGSLRIGERGVIVSVGGAVQSPSDMDDELERRLLELGFVEGASVELIHEGIIGRDPIAVRLADMRVALRRREAARILLRLDGRRA